MSRQKQKIATKAILMLFMSVCTLLAFAQGREVSGTILDDTGEPLIGVNVIVKGTTNGTITDFDGNFTLSGVNTGDVISASYIGYLPQEVTVGNQNVLNIVLKSDTQTLDEVVVVGYGIQKKSDVTGSVSSISSEALTAKGATSVMESMQGTVPGVDISQSSTRPGAGFNIQIRGKSSMQGGNPLYIVDGVVADNIDFLNPADIERIDILKDASSTAIYGSRATNGVVMVTTRSAGSSDKGRAVVSYDGYYGVKKIARLPDFMSGDEFTDYRFYRYTTLANTPLENNGIPQYQITDSNLSAFWCANSEVMKQKYLTGDYTDWSSLVTQSGQQQNHFIGVNGNAQNISYRLGIGYQDEDGIFERENYKRYNIKAAIDHKVNDYFSAGISVNLAAAKLNATSSNAVLNSFRTNPYFIPYDENGDPYLMPGGMYAMQSTGQFSSTINPLVDLANSSDETRTYDILSNIYFQVTPIKDLILKTTLSPTYTHSRRGQYEGSLTASRNQGTNWASLTNKERFTWTWDNQINYSKRWGDHDFGGLYVFSMYKNTYETSAIAVSDMPFETTFHNLASANTTENRSSAYQEITMLSHTFRLNYSYKGKYLATVSSRWDGSSKFTDGNKWGVFPSAALAWRMSEEEFLQKDWLSNLKLRASFGLTGNNAAVTPYGTQALASKLYYYTYGDGVSNGYGPNGLVNSALTWEKSREFNVGVDFSFLNGRINGTIDYYNKLSTDLIMERQMPLETGGVISSNNTRNIPTATMWDNVGKVRNSGIEIALTTVNAQNRDWRWETTFTFAKNKNKIVELYGGKTDDVGNKWFIGQPIDVLYNYELNGVVTQAEAAEYLKYGIYEGQAKVVDQNGDGVIDDQDRVILGSPMPDWTGSLVSNLSWKDFDFSFTITTRQGTTVFSPFIQEFTNYSDRGRAKIKMDYYIPAGVPTLNSDGTVGTTSSAKYGKYPYPTNDGLGGTYWGNASNEAHNHYVDASYVKIKNITLGYTVPKRWIEKAYISNLRVYFNVLNPFTITGYKGYDPEWADANLSIDSDGEGGGGPSTVTNQIGVNLKF
ncbi:MAG: TonB-dependent receptor [Tannerellaceae bacterium]|nr:TonB-dependent receptor [Tannerellaceae bacterium]